MNLYTIHTMQHEEEFFYGLFEEQTQQVIDFFYFHEDALKTSKFMSNGGAFAGFTPSFVLKSVSVDKDINKKMEKI